MDPRLIGHRTTRTTAARAYSTAALLNLLTGAGLVVALLAVCASAASASVAGAAMPWDAPLEAILSNFAGRTARALVIIAIVGCGLFWAFTRNEEGLKKLGQIAFGGAIALGAVALVAALGFDAAVV
jgi:type IV secretion system protein VirB2